MNGEISREASKYLSPRFLRSEGLLGTLSDDLTLPLGHHCDDADLEAGVCRAHVYGPLIESNDRDAAGLEVMEDVEQLNKGPHDPVELDDHDGIELPAAGVGLEGLPSGTVGILPGGDVRILLEYLISETLTEISQAGDLKLFVLIMCRDAGVDGDLQAAASFSA